MGEKRLENGEESQGNFVDLLPGGTAHIDDGLIEYARSTGITPMFAT
jgi:hypothetical protein